MEVKEVIQHMYNPHPAQRQMHGSKARFIVAPCGRRFGKTLFAINWIIDNAIDDVGNHWWAAPTYQQTKMAFRMCTSSFKNIIKDFNKSELRVELINGSIVEFKSTELYKHIVGTGLKSLVMDECGIINEDAWTESLRPALMDYKGKGLFIGTPKGRNWYYELYIKGQHPDFPDWQSFHFTSHDNPYLDDNELKGIEDLPEAILQQEIYAEFIEDSTTVFHGLDKVIQGTQEASQLNETYTVGVDLAKKVDYTVITVMRNRDRHVVYQKRFKDLTWQLQKSEIIRVVRDYNNASVWIDSTGVGDPIYEDLSYCGITITGYRFTNQSKVQLIQKLIVDIENINIGIPLSFDVLLDEMRLFIFTMTKLGLLQYSAPSNKHDDTVISLALANYGCPNIEAATTPYMSMKTQYGTLGRMLSNG